MTDDLVTQATQEVVNDIFSDLEKDGEFGKSISKLFAQLIVLGVTAGMEKAFSLVKEHPEVLEDSIV